MEGLRAALIRPRPESEETRGGAPAISDLLRTAIVVSLPMLSSAPAAAR